MKKKENKLLLCIPNVKKKMSDNESESDYSSFDGDLSLLHNQTVLTKYDGPFHRMPQSTRAAFPDWEIFDAEEFTVVLNNVFTAPRHDPTRNKMVMRLVRNRQDYFHPDFTMIFFFEFNVVKSYVPCERIKDMTCHEDLKWLILENRPTMLIYHK